LATRTLTIDEFLWALDLPYQLSDGQLEDIYIAVHPLIQEALFVRARGGSKSKDIGCICGLYMAHLGFHSVMYVAEADMLAQPKQYLRQLVTQSFLRFAVQDLLKESVTFNNGGLFEILNLTEGKARSRRVDWVYYDEEAQADEDALNASEGTLSVSVLGLIRHGSTPVKGSVFERNFNRLKAEGMPVMVRPWYLLPHIQPKHVERMKRKLPAWFFRQEYECTFEAAQGKVFEQVVRGPIDLSECTKSWQRTYVHYGLDWNPRAGHYLVGSRWNDDYTKCFVISEHNLGTDLNTAITTIINILEQNDHSLLEMEDGGTNSGYCDAFFLELYKLKTPNSITNRIYRRPWDSAGKNKHKSITLLMSATLYVDPDLTPDVAYWLDVAHWDEASSEPKLEKDPDQHALDGYLHSSWIAKWGITASA